METRLKALKTTRAGGSPDARWLASTRETLLMQIQNTVSGAEARKTGFQAFAESVRLFMPQQWAKAVAVPLAVVFLALGTGAGASLAVAAAQKTLPGDFLYEVKLLAERASLKVAGRLDRTGRRVEIAGRRLEEMARLAASVDPKKEDKITRVSGLFSAEMSSIRKDLSDLQAAADADEAVLVALRVDAKADEYHKLFKQGSFLGRTSFRLALLSLDQVSVKALEILVEKRAIASNVLPEAQLTSAVGKKIETLASHVAATMEGPAATKAKEAVEEAKVLLSQGDFKAAVRKVSESADLATEAETQATEAQAQPAEAQETLSSSDTSESAPERQEEAPVQEAPNAN